MAFASKIKSAIGDVQCTPVQKVNIMYTVCVYRVYHRPGRFTHNFYFNCIFLYNVVFFLVDLEVVIMLDLPFIYRTNIK